MFNNKVVLITGAAQGIGYAAAKQFLEAGAVVAVNDISDTIGEAYENLSKISDKIEVFEGDISKEVYVEEIFKQLENKYEKLDALVHCVAINKANKILDISMEEWQRVMDVNLNSMFLVSKYAVKLMKKNNYGKIVLVSSIAGRHRSPTAGIHYTTSKSAVLGFTRQLSYETAPYNINVNCVCPGQTLTPMLEKYLTPEVKKQLENKIPLGYIAKPEHQANVIKFLVSDESEYMTGAVVDVNGGQL